MGYPFDRFTPGTIGSLLDFTKPYVNMLVTPVKIRFTNTVIARA